MDHPPLPQVRRHRLLARRRRAARPARGQAHGRAEQRRQVLAARATPSRPRCSTSPPASCPPTRSPRSSSTSAPAGLTARRPGRDRRPTPQEFGTLDTLDGEVIGPIPSEDGEAAQIIVPLDLGTDGWNLAADAVDDLRATAEDGPDGLDVYVTGPAGQAADSSAAFEGIDGTLLYAAVARRHRHPAASPTAARSSGSCRSSPRASRSPSRRPSSTCSRTTPT